MTKRVLVVLLVLMMLSTSLLTVSASELNYMPIDVEHNSVITRAVSGYVLQDSTVIGGWLPIYETYNCYVYALGRSTPYGYLPGYYSSGVTSWDPYKDRSSYEVALMVQEDLLTNSFPYTCVRVS